MRSGREIWYRSRQELANVVLWKRPPLFRGTVPECFACLPQPSEIIPTLKNSRYAGSLIETAEQILTHRFPVLGLTLSTGPEISWRRDYVSGKETGPEFFRKIPYLEF